MWSAETHTHPNQTPYFLALVSYLKWAKEKKEKEKEEEEEEAEEEEEEKEKQPSALQILRGDEMGGLPWIMCPESSRIYLCKREAEEDFCLSHTYTRGRQCDHRGRNWNDAAISQGMLATTRSWKRQRTNFSLDPP